MRMMLKAIMPTEKSNHAIRDGTLPQTVDATLARLQPEAAYFTPVEGKRALMVFFDMTEPERMPVILEPLFELDAEVELVPVMNAHELREGLAKAVPVRAL